VRRSVRETVDTISASTVWRILNVAAIRGSFHVTPTSRPKPRWRWAAFELRYNQRGVPFDWTFGRDDLDNLIARIDAHEQRAA
jgi:hypothetical protein